MAANAMETDDLGHLPSSTLRRSNSAPNVSAAVVSDPIPIFQPLQTSRQRRFSTSQMAVNVGSPASRIEQIKREESMDDASRERQVESELFLTIGIHENMTLMDHDKNNDSDMHERRNSFDDPRHAFPSPSSLSSSPTNNQRGMRNARSLTPSPVPSPTRQTFTRRSLSPVYFRPSTLALKRKCPSEGFEPGVSPSKRLCDVSPLNCSPDVPCESVHLNFDDDNHLNEYPISSAASDTSSTSSSSSATPMLLGEMQRHPLPVYRSKFTPPRSPLAEIDECSSQEVYFSM
ncbi:hypothetical protein ACROYT_G026988 [Oculina patagonica]